MKVAELIDQRRPAWQRLEVLCEQMANRKARASYATVTEFAAIYRDTCADLALAESNQLPTDTVDYLHSLVARAHNQLYRSRAVDLPSLIETILFETPQQIFREPCVHLAALIFWGLFAMSAFLSYNDTYWPTFALDVVGADQLEGFESMYAGMGDRSWGQNSAMTGFYIFNNAGIGLRVFATMLLILPGLAELGSNAVNIGAVFGHMFRPDQGLAGENFRMFVTAHGPCELTAIVLSAGAGLRIGLSWLITHGRSRIDSLMINAQKCLPIALCAVALFVIAAFIEGFISPAPNTSIPYFLKCLVAIATSAMLMVYFVILGYPWARR